MKFNDLDILSKSYLDVLEILKVEEENSLNELSNFSKPTDKCTLVKKIVTHLNLPEDVQSALLSELLGNGPIDELIKKTDITEVLINDKGEIFYERNGIIFNHTQSFLSAVSYAGFVDRLTSAMNATINYEYPFCNGQWENFRVHIIGPPLTRGYHISLRRQFGIVRDFNDLIEKKWAPPSAVEILKQLVIDKKSFLIVGGTGSGKTSVLNICLKLTEPNERIISIEDTKEIQLPNNSCVSLLTRAHCFSDNKDINQSELLKQSLRMRPDRIVVGEIRGAEAKDYIMALSTGHGGSISTLHADNPHQALTRLELLIQMGAPEWKSESIRQLIHLGLQYIIVLKNYSGVRQLKGIYQISSLEDFGFCLDEIYKNPHGN